MLPSFVLAQQQSWRAGAGPPQASSGMLQQGTGKAKHPQKQGTAWRELGAAKPSRKAWQERDCQAQVMFPFLFVWLWHPRGLLCWAGSMWKKGRAMALTPALNRVPLILWGLHLVGRGHCRGFSTAAGNF